MPYPARHLFVVLFALLQCVAPLLHAHASAADHGGLHLPDLPAQSPRSDDAGWADAKHAVCHAAIGMAASLEARDEGLPPNLPGPMSHGLRLMPIPAGACDPVMHWGAEPRLVPHLLPPPAAPPAA